MNPIVEIAYVELITIDPSSKESVSKFEEVGREYFRFSEKQRHRILMKYPSAIFIREKELNLKIIDK